METSQENRQMTNQENYEIIYGNKKKEEIFSIIWAIETWLD